MNTPGNKKENPAVSTQFTMETLEAPARVGAGSKPFFIGIPKDTTHLEKRVPLTPGAVSMLVNIGHRVIVESGAGAESHFYNNEYSEAGAELSKSKEEVYKAQLIIKMGPPTLDDIELMQHGQMLLSPVQLPSLTVEIIQALQKKKISWLAFEYTMDDNGNYPIVTSMSEIAGSTAILIASEYLSHHFQGKGILLGGISGVPPAKVVILGAGVVGEFATRTALGIGATVKIFDNNIYKLMNLQNRVGQRVFTSVLDQDVLMRELRTADVAIGAIHSKSGRTPIIVTEQMVSNMRSGSVVVDVSIDQGGCFETSELTTHENPVVKKYDVIHYGVPNIPSRVSRTASYAISNIMYPILESAYNCGGFEEYLNARQHARHGCLLFKGILCNVHLSERFNLKYTDLNLLFASKY